MSYRSRYPALPPPLPPQRHNSPPPLPPPRLHAPLLPMPPPGRYAPEPPPLPMSGRQPPLPLLPPPPTTPPPLPPQSHTVSYPPIPRVFPPSHTPLRPPTQTAYPPIPVGFGQRRTLLVPPRPPLVPRADQSDFRIPLVRDCTHFQEHTVPEGPTQARGDAPAINYGNELSGYDPDRLTYEQAPPTYYGYHDNHSTSSPQSDRRVTVFREPTYNSEPPRYQSNVPHPPIPSLFDRLPGGPSEREAENRDEWVQRSNQQLDNEWNNFPVEGNYPPQREGRAPPWHEQEGGDPHVHHRGPPRQVFSTPPYHSDYRDSPHIPAHGTEPYTPNHRGRPIHHSPSRGRSPRDTDGNSFSRDDGSPVATPIAPPPVSVRTFNDRGTVSLPHVPKIEVKTVLAERLFEAPGRDERPSHVVIVIRGLPGSGKSHLAKIIRDKEVGSGGTAPRILALDSYFLSEVERVEKDPETGRRVKQTVEEYEYDGVMESVYRNSLFKLFNKTLDEGFFPLVIVDAVHEKVCHFDRYWSTAKMKGFEVYIVEVDECVSVCVDRNVHKRTRQEIEKLHAQWEDTPPHFTRLDVTPLLSDSNIDEVEMQCTDSEGENDEKKTEEAGKDEAEDDKESELLAKSRWEDTSEGRLDKLDAVRSYRKRKRLHSEQEDDISSELSLKEYLGRKQDNGNVSETKKRRVRWADLEAEKDKQRKREIGFVIGSGWSQVTDEEAERLLGGDGDVS